MQIQKSVSAQSVEDFRAAVADSFDTNGAVLLNLIEALAVGPRPGAPVEVSESAVFAYGHDSLYQGLRRAAAALGQEIDSDDWLLARVSQIWRLLVNYSANSGSAPIG